MLEITARLSKESNVSVRDSFTNLAEEERSSLKYNIDGFFVISLLVWKYESLFCDSRVGNEQYIPEYAIHIRTLANSWKEHIECCA